MNITPEILQALITLRSAATGYGMDTTTAAAFNVLDNADLFAEIDEAAHAHYQALEEDASKPNGLDPAEWGDMAFGPRN